MDPSTVGIFETSITVGPGTPFTVTAWFVPSPFSPPAFDGVALDLSIGVPGDTATAGSGMPIGVGAKAGPMVTIPFDFDAVSGGITGGGVPLTSALLPSPVPGATFNFGGAGVFSPSFFFGGASSPAIAPFDLMGWDLIAGPSPGVVTLTLLGAYAPLPYAPTTPGIFTTGGGTLVPAPGGVPLYDSFSGATIPDLIGSGYSILIVPEPSVAALMALGLAGLFGRRRRRA